MIISEPMGYMLVNERMLESFLHAKKWLKPEGMSNMLLHYKRWKYKRYFLPTETHFPHTRIHGGIIVKERVLRIGDHVLLLRPSLLNKTLHPGIHNQPFRYVCSRGCCDHVVEITYDHLLNKSQALRVVTAVPSGV